MHTPLPHVLPPSPPLLLQICIINDASYAKVPDYWEEEVAYLASKKPKVWSAVAA